MQMNHFSNHLHSWIAIANQFLLIVDPYNSDNASGSYSILPYPTLLLLLLYGKIISILNLFVLFEVMLCVYAIGEKGEQNHKP